MSLSGRFSGSLPLAAGSEHEVSSSGFLSPDGRPVDPIMLEVAKDAGLDLTQLRSNALNKSAVDEADIRFLMELQQVLQLTGDYPQAGNKTFMLRFASRSQWTSKDIEDPFGQPRERL